MAYDFKYIRTGTGELSGPSMIWQTEQALTQIGTYADEANTKADEALETANTALNKANEAAEAAERAQNTADAAQAAASHAQDTADAAQSAAGDAQNTANEALEAAQKGVADAAKAQTAADKAQASADAAQTAADTAQLTADSAQNAADKAQGTADAAQKTATIALDTANNSQSSANVAQDTADNALLVSQSTQQAFYEHVREYTTQIAQALGEFEADSTTVDFDNFTNPIKLYITSPDASITIPDGQVNAPFYLWNFTTDDRSSTAQFVYAANGLEYSRYGTIGQDSLIPGTDTYTLENNSKNATLTCTGVASGMSIAKSGTLVNTWTASDTRPSYILGTWVITGIANGTINLNGVTIATLSDTGFYPTGQQLQEDNTSFVIENMTYSATGGLTITAAVQWLNFDSQITWDGWKAGSGSGGTVATDGVTIRYNSASNLQAKDIAINGDESDLASARGIFDTLTKGSVDCNTLTDQGVYAISLVETVNGPGFSAKLIVFNGKNSKITNQMALAIGAGTSGAVRVAYRARNSEEIWSTWSEGILSGRIGDGLTVNNGIISVPEYEGATASAAGTSGLVPPAAAGQQESFLTGGGEYKPALTKISDSVNLADSKTAASAKAVKAAYDRGTDGVTAANGKLSLSGGVMSGRIGGLRGNYNADASSRYATGALEIRENGGVGSAQSDIAYAPTIGFHWANKVAGLLALRSDGIFTFLKQNGTRAVVDCDVPYATAANKLRREGGVDTSWWWSGQGGQPGWLWGGNDGTNMYVYNPANFSVNYANSAGSAATANTATGLTYTFTKNSSLVLPPGGTWFVLNWWDGDSGTARGNWSGGQIVAGGSSVGVRNGAFALRVA